MLVPSSLSKMHSAATQAVALDGDFHGTKITLQGSTAEPCSRPLGCLATPPTPSEVEVWIVRHGERVDEAPGNTWVKCGKKNPLWFDPALTERGHEHATRVAHVFRDQFANEGEGRVRPFHAIYTSPLIRTVQTAEKFSAV